MLCNASTTTGSGRLEAAAAAGSGGGRRQRRRQAAAMAARGPAAALHFIVYGPRRNRRRALACSAEHATAGRTCCAPSALLGWSATGGVCARGRVGRTPRVLAPATLTCRLAAGWRRGDAHDFHTAARLRSFHIGDQMSEHAAAGSRPRTRRWCLHLPAKQCTGYSNPTGSGTIAPLRRRLLLLLLLLLPRQL